MKKEKQMVVVLAVALAIFAGALSVADSLINDLPTSAPPTPLSDPVNPRSPEEWHARQALLVENWSRWPWRRIRQLEAAQNQLTESISELPQHQPIFYSDHMGYHSPFATADIGDTLPPHQIDFTWAFAQRLDSIAFAPALDVKSLGSYAFPTRFKIEVVNAETNQFETVVDWMDEDFPDPGLYAVFFAGIDRLVQQVRLTVPQVPRASGASYYALGEVYLFQQKPDGSLGANMTGWGAGGVDIEQSRPFSMQPRWDIQYLADGVVGLGVPLGDKIVDSKDLMVTYDDDGSAPDEVQVILDLGRLRPIGGIDFWPAAAPYSLELPSFGFPGNISVELSADPNFETVKVVRVYSREEDQHRGETLSMIAGDYQARYIRVTLSDLAEHEGKRILGLGEILVSDSGVYCSINCKVTALGIPDDSLDQLPRLVDGCSWQHRILPQGDWIRGLAQRRPMDERLTRVELALERARVDWRLMKQRSAIGVGVIMVIGLMGRIIVHRRLRKRGINKLKMRIARDLHDDVGSNLGSILLTVEQLKDAEVGTEVREDLGDLSLLTREACASLREVVWVIDESTIRLPNLIGMLAERAERVLHDMELSIEISPDVPDSQVSLTCKRHLILFFKEAIHNCARHAEATRAWVTFSTDDQCLHVSIRDDGCGFDPSLQSGGWGLDSMKDRAEEIGGEVTVSSQIGEGTLVVLTVSLTSLLNNVDHSYTSSN
jgi:signal transduction histidine kinase